MLVASPQRGEMSIANLPFCFALRSVGAQPFFSSGNRNAAGFRS
jgi:hypothetical protein